MSHTFLPLKTFQGWGFSALDSTKSIVILQRDLGVPISNTMAVNLENGEIIDNSERIEITSISPYRSDDMAPDIPFDIPSGFDYIEYIHSSDGQYIFQGYTGEKFSGFRILNPESRELLYSIDLGNADLVLGRINSDSKIFVGCKLEFITMSGVYEFINLNIFDLESLQLLHTVKEFGCFSVSGDMELILYSQNKKICIFDARHRHLYCSDTQQSCSDIAVSDNKKTILTTNGYDRDIIKIFEVDDDKTLLERQVIGKHPSPVVKMIFGSDDRTIIVTYKDYGYKRIRGSSPSTTVLYRSCSS
jgi:hypothetical protein